MSKPMLTIVLIAHVFFGYSQDVSQTQSIDTLSDYPPLSEQFSAREINTGMKKVKSFWTLSFGTNKSELFGSFVDRRLDQSPEASVSTSNGVYAGILHYWRFGKWFFFKTGLAYMQKESSIISPTYSRPMEGNTSYLSAPIGFGFLLPVNKRVPTFSVGAGINVQGEIEGSDGLEVGLNSIFIEKVYNIPVSYYISPKVWVPLSEKISLFVGYEFQKDINSFFGYSTTSGGIFSPNPNDGIVYEAKFKSQVMMFGLALNKFKSVERK